jgi:hypothetical protein
LKHGAATWVWNKISLEFTSTKTPDAVLAFLAIFDD